MNKTLHTILREQVQRIKCRIKAEELVHLLRVDFLAIPLGQHGGIYRKAIVHQVFQLVQPILIVEFSGIEYQVLDDNYEEQLEQALSELGGAFHE